MDIDTLLDALGGIVEGIVHKNKTENSKELTLGKITKLLCSKSNEDNEDIKNKTYLLFNNSVKVEKGKQIEETELSRDKENNNFNNELKKHK